MRRLIPAAAAVALLAACDGAPAKSAADDTASDATVDESDDTEAASDDSQADSQADDTQIDTAPPTGDGLFAEGCPTPGEALARRIDVDGTLPGITAVGTRGDFLLANERAAFVITEPDKGSTYYYYGGVVADASPMDGCTPGEDKLDEIGLVYAEANLTDFNQSNLRAFRGQAAEVISDGSDGSAAVVRVSGVDDVHWLVEYTLFAGAVDEGGREFSEPYGVAITLDYILEPGSGVLRVEQTLLNTSDDSVSLVSGGLLSFKETMDVFAFSSGSISVPGLSLDYGIPWLLATDLDSALAWSLEQGNMGYTSISGVQIAIDLAQLLGNPLNLAPGESDVRAMFLSLGGSDGPSATTALAEANPTPINSEAYTLDAVSGQVLDLSGAPVADARVDLEANSGGDWGVVDVALADADGRYTLPMPIFDAPWSWRLVASAPGRDDSPPVDVSPGETDVALAVSGTATVTYAITDDRGEPSPARLALDRSDGVRFDLWLAGEGELALPPGSYAVTATRGYEYAPHYDTLEVADGDSAALAPVLARVVDTTGYLSADTHVHTSQSPDGRVSQSDQLLHAAAHGLEVVVHTEHEKLVDQSAVPDDAGVAPWVNNVNGEEVTASLPEHLTMFPAEPDGTPRGGIVDWYGKDIDAIFAEMRERSGDGINLLNHPGYLDTIDWDRLVAEPRLTDPTLLGLAPDAAVWSWNLDGVEVMNGHSSPFIDGKVRFDNWMSMVNAGHPLIAVGCSDDHGGNGVGFPRTYFASTTDDPGVFEESDLVDAFKAGHAIASAGAFARVSADGAVSGEVVTVDDGVVVLDVHIEAIPEIDVTHFVVFWNCDEVLSVAAEDPGGVVKFSGALEIPVDGDGHLVVAAFGDQRLPAGMPQFDGFVPRVLVNPIYVDADGDGLSGAPGGRECSYTLTAP